MKISVKAYAKINLTLDIVGRRDDGYHDLRSIMQTVDISEYVEIEENNSGKITVFCNMPDIPCDDSNIAVKCAKAFFEASELKMTGLHIAIQKNIPQQAGLAGGSADGAAVLRGLNELHKNCLTEEQLIAVGASVGADIPFCLVGGTALAEGIGERLTKLPDIPKCSIVIVKPPVGISTAQAYGAVDHSDIVRADHTERILTCLHDIGKFSGLIHNDFEESLCLPEINTLVNELKGFEGCLGACMSGSGSACFAIFEDHGKAESCANLMSGKYPFAAAVYPTSVGTVIIA